MTTRGSSTPSSSTTSVHLTALDDLVNVNSLFTIAVFVGLSLKQHSLENRTPATQASTTDVDEALRANINSKVLRFGMMGSAIGSVMGCVLLMLSMINVMGILSCGNCNLNWVVLSRSHLDVSLDMKRMHILDHSDSGVYYGGFANYYF
ncbi:hypothetical protein Peur_002583 [Populus x canadensis]